MQMSVFSTCVLIMSLLNQVSGLTTIAGKYGETVEVPCDKGDIKQEDIIIVKWKYTKEDGSIGDLLKKSQNITFFNIVEYQGRINLTKALNLQIYQAKMSDQKTFVCMVVLGTDILEFPVQVTIQKAPAPPTITNQATVIELGKLTTLAECSAKDANPAASITWLKDNVPLVNDGKVVTITPTVQTDKVTSLSSTSSKLEYTASKADMNAKFTCAVQHKSLASDLVSGPMNFTIHYPTEKVSLQVVSAVPIKEGDNVTLKCAADGNPPPTSYNFHIKGKKVTTDNSDTYTLTGVTRVDSGEYKCSLVDNETKTGSTSFTVMYLDINATKGMIVKKVSESFAGSVIVSSSEIADISWTKNNIKLKGNPVFEKLKYADSGVYECVVSMAGLVKKASFELSVKGAAAVSQLTKGRSKNGGNLLSCKAEGSPKPTVQWNINGTNASESPYVNGTVTYNLTVTPNGNFTANCTVFNELGSATKSVFISTLAEETLVNKGAEQSEDSKDQTQVAVGVVVGLIVIAVIIGLAYWIYMKRTREGSWKTGEKENGTQEESKKLEETQSQKADV